jgi:MFS transporter, DHA1 family, multidrug resistance protein
MVHTDESTRSWWRQPDLGLGRDVGLLFWANLFSGAAFAVQATLWTLFIRGLGANPQQIGVVVGGAAIARTVLAVPAGSLVDRLSPKPIILAASILPVVGTVIFIAATDWWHALAGALLLEMSGLAIPAVSAYIAAATDEERRTRAYTYVYTLSTQTGLTIMPVFGGLLAEWIGFRSVYVVSGLLFALAILFFARITNRRPVGHRDNDDGSGSARPGYRQLLQLPGVWVVVTFHLLVPLLPFIAIALLPNFLNEERGLSYATLGLLGSIGSAVGLGMSLVVSHWRPLGRPFFGMGVCLALIATGLGLFLSSGIFVVIVVAYMLRCSMGSVWSLLAAAVADVTPERLRGRAYGLCELGAGAGDVGAPLVAGALYDANPRLPLWVGMLMTAPLALSALLVHRLRDRLAPPASVTDAAARA